MTDNDLKAMMADLIQRQARTDEHINSLTEKQDRTEANINRLTEKTDAQISRVTKELGNMGRSRGEIAEEFFFRSLEKNPNVGGYHFDVVDRHFRNHVGNVTDEYDVVLINGKQILVVEVKARAKTTDIKRFITKKLPNFRLLFPMYKDYKILAAVASLTSTDTLIARAKELGVFLLTQQGDHMALVNDKVKAF